MRRRARLTACLLIIAPAALVAQDAPGVRSPASEPAPATVQERFAREGEALSPLVRTDVAKGFLDALEHLASVREGRAVRYDRATGDAMTLEAYDALADDDERRDAYDLLPVDDALYYTRLFGTPALYARTIDVASLHGLASAHGARIMDFGFGHVGHLRALASRGAHCVGVEVSPLFEAMYAQPEDTGFVDRHEGAPSGPAGTLRLVFGSWPRDAGVRAQVGGRFDAIITKNVLKRGYIHPEREADPSELIDLGAPDDVFLRALRDALVPGGLVVIYNYSPAQAPEGERFIPWADGRCPFDEGEILEAGFEILAYDEDDTPSAIDHFVGVGAGERDALEGELFGMYTVLRRPAE